MTYKGQILLGTGDAGWSETYHIDAGSHAAAMTALDSICTARMGMSRSDVTVRVLRVSDEAIKGDSFLQAATTSAGGYTGAGTFTFDPAVALLVTGYSGDHTAWTHWFVRGLPSDVVSNQEPFKLAGTPPASWTTAFNSYKAALVANAKLKTKKPNPPGTVHTIAIATTGFGLFLVIRKAGRPFGLRHGRRVIV